MAEPTPQANQAPQSQASLDDVRPEEIYERMASYVSETENLIGLLRDSLSKGEAQLTEIATFDSRVTQLGNGLTPMDTATLQTEIEDIRKHIASLEEFRDRTKTDMDKVKKISERIASIVNQYKIVK